MKVRNIAMLLSVAMLIVALPMAAALDRRTTDIESMKKLDVEELEAKVVEQAPESYEKAVDSVGNTLNRYLLYTRDGKNIMWGHYFNGIFAGTDNHGKHTWGIYGKYIFAGFYDGEFFYGKYRSGRWKANGLFDLEESSGRYVLFPERLILKAQKVSLR